MGLFYLPLVALEQYLITCSVSVLAVLIFATRGQVYMQLCYKLKNILETRLHLGDLIYFI